MIFSLRVKCFVQLKTIIIYNYLNHFSGVKFCLNFKFILVNFVSVSDVTKKELRYN